MMIQKNLDYNKLLIEQNLKRIQQKILLFNKEMKEKLSLFISRDIRPPVLVIPCPGNRN